MSEDPNLKPYEEAFSVDWESAPEELRQQAMRPPATPIPGAIDPSASRISLPAEDVRATLAAEGAGAMTTLRVGPVDVTVMLDPPAGGSVWTLRGRAWIPKGPRGPMRVLLSVEDHVVAEQELEHGGSFTFREILEGEPSLEFHLSDGRVATVSVPLP